MKHLKFLILIFYSYSSFGQNNSLKTNLDSLHFKFSLTLTIFNHSEVLFHGTTTYKLTDRLIMVTNTSFGDKKGKVIFQKSIPDSLNISSAIGNIGLDSLKDFYFNYCVMATSGIEYILNFKSHILTKQIDLHHYYLNS